MNPEETNMAQSTPPAAVAQKNIGMAVLSYLGPLVIISYLTAKDDPFVKFHIKQGLVLLTLEVAVWLLSSLFFSYAIWLVWRLVHLAIFVLAVIGIITAAKGEEKKLPVIGDLAKHFTF